MNLSIYYFLSLLTIFFFNYCSTIYIYIFYFFIAKWSLHWDLEINKHFTDASKTSDQLYITLCLIFISYILTNRFLRLFKLYVHYLTSLSISQIVHSETIMNYFTDFFFHGPSNIVARNRWHRNFRFSTAHLWFLSEKRARCATQK